jgi:hypothetical protein
MIAHLSPAIYRAVHALSISVACLAIACGGSEPPPKTSDDAPEMEDDERRPSADISSEVGGLNEQKVDKAFEGALDNLQSCLNDGARRVEFLGGSVSFFVKINSKGRVANAYAEKSTLGDRETEKCMLDSLRKKRWPKPVGGQVGLARKSFDFDPPNDVRPPTEWDGENVSQVLEKLEKDIRGCKNGVSGQFEATLYVATDGSVLSVGVTPPSEEGEEAVDCLVDALKSASFPSPGSWPAKVTFAL